jgi:hypothetical protein
MVISKIHLHSGTCSVLHSGSHDDDDDDDEGNEKHVGTSISGV